MEDLSYKAYPYKLYAPLWPSSLGVTGMCQYPPSQDEREQHNDKDGWSFRELCRTQHWIGINSVGTLLAQLAAFLLLMSVKNVRVSNLLEFVIILQASFNTAMPFFCNAASVKLHV